MNKLMCLIFFFALLNIENAFTQKLSIEEVDGGIRISEGNVPVLVYKTRESSPKAETGPFAFYVHPLYDLDGNILTEEFPKDHIHHRGVFWAWHQVFLGNKNLGDDWLGQDIRKSSVKLRSKANKRMARIVSVVNWKSDKLEDGQPFMREKTTVTAHVAGKGYRFVDFEIELSALSDSLYLGGDKSDKGYGGFSTRVKMPEDIRFSGKQGLVEPKRTAVEAGDWLSVEASFNGKPSGLAIISHQDNPGNPQPWILRKKNSMQNVVWPGKDKVFIPKGKSVKLKYRLVIYEGDLPSEVLTERFL
ncbi:hypothetical protein FUAX_52590 (plasmid) [Fulvitalea axinellae]|uniref:Methane oxygenase PmoA n=1 Tax=Fulvitalea axinellae TaxID=1182444 RepID=A0AAU9D105_9BACT|nr:hypothetical protein FUAX_52590 [Fulvitalea axinellae]